MSADPAGTGSLDPKKPDADEEVSVFEGGAAVTTSARKLDFDAADFNIAEDIPNDQADIAINRNAANGIAGLDALARLLKATQHANTVYNDQANTYADGMKQTVDPSAANAGLNIGIMPGSANPTSLANGDLFITSAQVLKYGVGGSAVEVLGGGLVQTVTGKKSFSGSFTNATLAVVQRADDPTVSLANGDFWLNGDELKYRSNAVNRILSIVGHAHVKADISDFAHTHPKSEIDDAGAWLASEIPDLDTSKITTGQFPMARLASGVPDGTKFIRDDGVLVAPTASVNIKETEIDFGASGKQNKSFVITDAGVTSASQIIAALSFKAATGQEADEAEMEAENLHFTCKAGTGQFTLYGAVKTGTVQRKYLVNYLVG